jgi:hypothetical protein
MYQQYYKKDATIILSVLLLTALFFYWLGHSSETIETGRQNVPTPRIVASAPPVPQKPCIVPAPYDSEINEVFGDEACNAKKVLRWTDAQGNVYGENTNFITENADRIQKDGSVDRGLFRINSNTFKDYMHRMPQYLHNNSIYTWDDMLDPVLNIRMAQIIYLYQGWCGWFGAPNDLCSANYPNVKAN